MTGGIETVHAHEHASERHCPYCHDVLAEGAERWRCAKCATELHAGCAKELVKCPTLGCREPTVRVETTDPELESVREHAVRATAWSLFAGLMSLGLAFIALVCAAVLLPRREDGALTSGSSLAAWGLAILIALAGGVPATFVGAQALVVLVTGRANARLYQIFGPRRPPSEDD